MARSTVDYENLMDTSFSDSTVRTNMRPRWERKKQQSSGSTTSANNSSLLVDPERRSALAGTTNTSSSDRFIPSRAGMNMEVSKHLIRSSSTATADPDTTTSSSSGDALPADQRSVSENMKDTYASSLSSALLGVDDLNSSRIMSYQEKAPVPKGDTVNNLNILYSAVSANGPKKSNTKLVTRQIPSAPSRILDAPDMKDDYYLNLVSWSDTNLLAVALDKTVYLWNAASGDITELCTFEDGGPTGHISSVAWVQEGGAHIAVGTSTGATQLWDVHACKQLRGMDGHSDRVSSLAWNRHILSSGSRDGTVVNHDVRVAQHAVATLARHTQEVCGLTWSPDGETLASGGNDNLLCLWDAAASNRSGPRYCMTEHQAAVKALAWSPHERNLLATGGGTADRTIKFWNTQTGSLLNSIDTGSQVCGLMWNPFEKEILSSHGFSRFQLSLWKYPSMALIKEFEGHSSRVLHLARSPDGGTVVSSAADETLRFWDVFCPPGKSKSSSTSSSMQSVKRGGFKSSWTAQIR